MKLISGSLLVALVSSAAWAAAPQPAAHAPEEIAQAEDAAPSAERVTLARRLIGLTLSPDEFMEIVRTSALQTATEKLVGADYKGDGSELEKEVNRFVARMEPAIRGQIPNLTEAYAQAYAREFSADELTEPIAFAQSPAGKHYISRVDFMDADPAVLEAQQGITEAMMPVLEEMRKEACAKRAAARVAAGDKKATCPLNANPTRDG
jgi:hypothetical protein